MHLINFYYHLYFNLRNHIKLHKLEGLTEAQVVKDCEVPKKPLHQLDLLDLFVVGLALVVVVTYPFYKRK